MNKNCRTFIVVLLILLTGYCGFIPLVHSAEVVISLENSNLIVKDAGFYISDIIDVRTDKSDIGYSLTNLANVRNPIKFKNDFNSELSGFFSDLLPKSDDKIPVVLTIYTFKSYEKVKIYGSYIVTDIEMGFSVVRNNKLIELYDAKVQKTDNGMLDTELLHKNNIISALNDCVDSFIQNMGKDYNIYDGPQSEFSVLPESYIKKSTEPLTIAVAEFDSKNTSMLVASAVSDFLRNSLVKTGKYIVISSNNMKKILEEQQFQQTGCTSRECVVRMGRILNIDYMITGKIIKSDNELYGITTKMLEIRTNNIIDSRDVVANTLDDLPAAAEILALQFAHIDKSFTKRIYVQNTIEDPVSVSSKFWYFIFYGSMIFPGIK
jgi:hypothetical protein